MKKENKNELELAKVNILITEEDKTGTDITKMSNFFDVYLKKLNYDLASPDYLSLSPASVVIDSNIISNILKENSFFVSNDKVFIPNFEALPKDILKKLKNGEYSIGESRQVNGDFRAVIVNGEGNRVKDVTLKQVKDNSQAKELANDVAQQLQLREINEKLDNVIEFQKFQIEIARDTNIRTHFYAARNYILLAQEESNKTKIEENLKFASKELIQGMSAIQADIETSGKMLAKSTSKIFTKPKFFPGENRQSYMEYLVEDLKFFMLFIGLESQICYYLGDKNQERFLQNSYVNTLTDFCQKGYGKNNKSIAIMLHEHFPYTDSNRDGWYHFKTQIEDKIINKSDLISSDSKVYLVGVEDIKNEKE